MSSAEAICTVFTVAFAVIFSILVGYFLFKVTRDKGYKNSLPMTLILSAVLSSALMFTYGVGITLIQGMFLFFVLLYASASDVTRHEVDDHIWITVLALSVLSIQTVGIKSMLIGAVMVFVPQMFVSLISSKPLGGADIKLTTAIAFMLGWQRGLAMLVISMILALICKYISDPLHLKEENEPFALVPYISIAALLMFLV